MVILKYLFSVKNKKKYLSNASFTQNSGKPNISLLYKVKRGNQVGGVGSEIMR